MMIGNSAFFAFQDFSFSVPYWNQKFLCGFLDSWAFKKHLKPTFPKVWEKSLIAPHFLFVISLFEAFATFFVFRVSLKSTVLGTQKSLYRVRQHFYLKKYQINTEFKQFASFVHILDSLLHVLIARDQFGYFSAVIFLDIAAPAFYSYKINRMNCCLFSKSTVEVKFLCPWTLSTFGRPLNAWILNFLDNIFDWIWTFRLPRVNIQCYR